jgi:hypothetical protein
MPYLIIVVHLYQTVFDMDTNLCVVIKMQCSTSGSASEQRNHWWQEIVHFPMPVSQSPRSQFSKAQSVQLSSKGHTKSPHLCTIKSLTVFLTSKALARVFNVHAHGAKLLPSLSTSFPVKQSSDTTNNKKWLTSCRLQHMNTFLFCNLNTWSAGFIILEAGVGAGAKDSESWLLNAYVWLHLATV